MNAIHYLFLAGFASICATILLFTSVYLFRRLEKTANQLEEAQDEIADLESKLLIAKTLTIVQWAYQGLKLGLPDFGDDLPDELRRNKGTVETRAGWMCKRHARAASYVPNGQDEGRPERGASHVE